VVRDIQYPPGPLQKKNRHCREAFLSPGILPNLPGFRTSVYDNGASPLRPWPWGCPCRGFLGLRVGLGFQRLQPAFFVAKGNSQLHTFHRQKVRQGSGHDASDNDPPYHPRAAIAGEIHKGRRITAHLIIG